MEGKIPAASWFNEIPDIGKLKVFGCIAYLKLPKELITGKFDSRTLKCYFIGYCPNGYKLLSLEKRKLLQEEMSFLKKRNLYLMVHQAKTGFIKEKNQKYKLKTQQKSERMKQKRTKKKHLKEIERLDK